MLCPETQVLRHMLSETRGQDPAGNFEFESVLLETSGDLRPVQAPRDRESGVPLKICD